MALERRLLLVRLLLPDLFLQQEQEFTLRFSGRGLPTSAKALGVTIAAVALVGALPQHERESNTLL